MVLWINWNGDGMDLVFTCLVWGHLESSTSHLEYSKGSGGELVPKISTDKVILAGTRASARDGKKDDVEEKRREGGR
jgi:hypothetical protein